MLKQEEVQEAITPTQGPSLHHASGADARDVSVRTLHYNDLCFGSRTSSVNRYIEVIPFSQRFNIVISGGCCEEKSSLPCSFAAFLSTTSLQ